MVKRKKNRNLPTIITALAVGILFTSHSHLSAEDTQATAPTSGPVVSTDTVASSGNPLDVTITGEAKDEIAIAKMPPSTEIPFTDFVSFSREKQTERILAEGVEHMKHDDQLKLLEVNSRQTVLPLPVRIPKPPFFQMEVPPGLDPQTWQFEVVDQNNQTANMTEGATLIERLLEWDGYADGAIKILAGPAYTPLLTVNTKDGKTQRFFGDPVQLEVLQYEQDGLLYTEFTNTRLYERNADEFSPESRPLLEACLNMMRLRVGSPFRVVIYEVPKQQALAFKRLELWKKYLVDQLLLEPEQLTLTVMSPKERGRVTSVMMMDKP